jgi:superfamily II DNA/RNA helicase
MLIVKIPNRTAFSIITYTFTTKQAPLRLPSFSHFPLHPTIFKFLEGNNIHTPTYIQYALLASLAKKQPSLHHITSPTGSGKTLSYLIPALSHLKKEEEGAGVLTAAHRPRAIIITANKELVLQCRNVGKQVSHHCKLKIEGIGIGRTINEENKLVEDGVDVLVSTYQRIKPLIEKKLLFLSNMKWLVVDEVDTLFEMGKLPAIMENLLIGAKKSQENSLLEIVLSGTTRSHELIKYLNVNLGEIT